ncbi:MAG: hypothetical protein HW401_871 [Parcubacteria group bacterium]|nr:hypothetical protein [Parcubacteria group bacterium]
MNINNREEKKIAGKTLKRIKDKKSDYWTKRAEEVSLKLFHEAAKKVPAYKDFLRKNKINPAKIKNFKDLKSVPATSKENYLRQYPLEDLTWNGYLKKSLVFTSTSGSTGAPFYFPRNHILDWQSSIYHQIFLENSGIDVNKSTLVMVCFGMGVWIGGLITYQAFRLISGRGYPLTIITPGVNKKEIFEALKNIGHKFDQIILCGYPPFMKDVVDEAKSQGVKWQDHNVRIIFAAESFSEKFREYIIDKTGIRDIHTGTMNIYGSADIGTMAIETPVNIMMRRIALERKSIYKNIFAEANRLPTFAQFNPEFINFESSGGNIYCTGNNTIPFLRYEIGDNGGVVSWNDADSIFISHGIDIRKEAKSAGLENTISELPSVYLYERTDMSTKLYGAIIFPEYVKGGLERAKFASYITGRFTMFTKHDRKHDEYLEINIELKNGVKPGISLEKEITRSIVESLLKNSAEHKNNANMMPDRVIPKIILWIYEHPLYFKSGVKQKWVKKDYPSHL